MSRSLGRGRYVWGTYPERSVGGGSPGTPDGPLSTIAFVDYGTVVPLGEQNGFIGTPYATVQQALDAGFTSVYINGNGSEDVIAPGFVLLTGMDGNVVLNSLTLPDNSGAQLFKVAVGTLTAGNSCNVIIDRGIGTIVFGTGGFLVTNGPGFLGFAGSGVDQLLLGDVTMGAGANLNATNTVFQSGTAVAIDGNIQMFGSASRCSMTVGALSAQSSNLTAGTYTTTLGVKLQGVQTDAGVVFANALAQPFDLDGFSNYWIVANGVAIANVGEKVITDNLTP